MAVKIYNVSSKVVIDDGTLIRDFEVSNVTYEIVDGVLNLFNNTIAIDGYDRVDIEDNASNTFATDLALSDYLSAFLSASSSSITISNTNEYGILGQSSPSATTLTTIYTVPSGKMIQELSGTVCNRSATATSFRIALRRSGASISNEHYIYYDVAIGGNDTFYFDIRIRLSATDIVSVYNTDATLSFGVYGEEIEIV